MFHSGISLSPDVPCPPSGSTVVAKRGFGGDLSPEPKNSGKRMRDSFFSLHSRESHTPVRGSAPFTYQQEGFPEKQGNTVRQESSPGCRDGIVRYHTCPENLNAGFDDPMVLSNR